MALSKKPITKGVYALTMWDEAGEPVEAVRVDIFRGSNPRAVVFAQVSRDLGAVRFTMCRPGHSIDVRLTAAKHVDAGQTANFAPRTIRR